MMVLTRFRAASVASLSQLGEPGRFPEGEPPMSRVSERSAFPSSEDDPHPGGSSSGLILVRCFKMSHSLSPNSLFENKEEKHL